MRTSRNTTAHRLISPRHMFWYKESPPRPVLFSWLAVVTHFGTYLDTALINGCSKSLSLSRTRLTIASRFTPRRGLKKYSTGASSNPLVKPVTRNAVSVDFRRNPCVERGENNPLPFVPMDPPENNGKILFPDRERLKTLPWVS